MLMILLELISNYPETIMAAIDVLEIGFIGLGAMGLGMASNLHKKPLYRVTGYDVYPPSAKKFASEGGNLGQSPREVAQNSKFLICMAANEQQVDDILFHSETGALKGMPLSCCCVSLRQRTNNIGSPTRKGNCLDLLNC